MAKEKLKHDGLLCFLLALIVVLILVIGGGAYYFLYLDNDNSITPNISKNNKFYVEEHNGEKYYVLDGEYDGEYDIQYTVFDGHDVPEKFEVSKVMTYSEYKDYCKEFDIKRNYNDKNQKYLVFSYASGGAAYIDVTLGGVEYNSETANLYIWDDANGVVASAAAYVIIIPTNENIKKIQVQPLYSKMEFNEETEKYPISGKTYTMEDNKKIAKASYINSNNPELNNIVNKMYDAIVTKHTIEVETKYDDNSIGYTYTDLINSTKKHLSDGVVFAYETITEMETIFYRDYWNSNSFKKETSNETREDILKSEFEKDDCYLLVDSNIKHKNIKIKEIENEFEIKAERKSIESTKHDVEEIYYIDKETYLLNRFIINDEKYGTNESMCLYTDTNIIIPKDVLETKEIFIRADKPIIYLYPTEETRVNVKLKNYENITCSYPRYKENGWNVIAKPNGDLIDLETGRNLYSLYWEGKNTIEPSMSEGFIVEGEKTAKFLEEKLLILGLTEREAEEFIIYWLPQLEKNKYNFIRFQTTEEINENMPLEVTPTPDTIIRVMMEWKGLEEYIEIPEQILRTPKRNGFTVVEWGGTEIK